MVLWSSTGLHMTMVFSRSSMTLPNLDPTLLREGRLQRYLRKLLKNGHLDRCIYGKIYPSGSQPARIYGLPKMHKARKPNSTPPFRPIVSSIGTYNYELAKYLCILLEPHIPSEYCALDTFTFVREINEFSSFKIRSMFSVKDPVPVELRSNVVYKFTCASCNSCYVGETTRHLSTRIREHLNRDRPSHIFQHLQQFEACRNSYSAECFEVIDQATTKFQVKIKEALHISWEQPSLNKQLYHVNLTLSF